MCGIAGFFSRHVDRPEYRALIEQMNEPMSRRGPDGQGVYARPKAYLGHRRLSIIDLEGGHQPMALPDDRAVIVLNGEIYNYLELRQQQLGYLPSQPKGDTETLLWMLKRQGEKAISLLNGMFAFAYWDKDSECLLLARDPVGQKPLFYHYDDENFVFASSLISVAQHPAVSLDVDPEALSRYLVFEGFAGADTALKGVRKLEPGHLLRLDLRTWRLSTERYWDNPIVPGASGVRSDEDYLEEFEHEFKAAVERSLRADVDVGVFLSGGLDSTSIVKAATSLKGKGSFQTFTIKHELASFDESVIARQTSEYFGTKHHEKLLSERDFFSDLDRFVGGMDEPIADPGCLAISQVSKFAREKVKVIVSGNGGDEFLAGYAPFQAIRAASVANRLVPAEAVKLFRALAALLRASHDYMNLPFKVERFLRGLPFHPAELLYQWIGAFNREELTNLLVDRALATDVYRPLHQAYERMQTKDLFSVILNTFQQVYLPASICNHSDKASMYHSLELRSPFLDPQFMRFANRLPSDLKFRGGKTKYILRLFHQRGSLPELARKRKQGFTVPMARWLTSTLKPWGDQLLSAASIQKSDFFNAAQVQRLWSEHQNRRANHAKKLWTLLVFQHWYTGTLAEVKQRRTRG